MNKSHFRIVFVIAGVLVVSSAIAVALMLWQLREDAIAEGLRNSDGVASIIGEETEASVQAIELVLDEVVAATGPMSFHGDGGGRENHAIFAYIEDRLAHLPQADVITIADETGAAVFTTRGWPTPDIHLSDRDYFKHAASTPGPQLFISAPVQNKITREWTFYFTKRLETADGGFRGVALIGVKPEALIRMFAPISTLRGDSVLLLRSDGTMLLRDPDPVTRTGAKLPAQAPWYRLVAVGGGDYRSPGYFDNEPRWVSVRPLKRYPLVVDVSTTESQLLAMWRARAIAIVLVGAVIELVLGGLLAMLYLQFQRQQEGKTKLAQKSAEVTLANARFEATLSSMSQGVAMFGGEGQLLIYNRKYREIWGAGAEELQPGARLNEIAAARAARGLFAPESLHLATEPSLFALSVQPPAVLRLTDGRSIRVTTDPMPGGGWVTTHEDITDSQRAQAEIAHMATHDALTGLLNRAGFMSRLLECEAATRDAELSVMLLDLARLKEINDAYGHWVGDSLLCAVSERLRGVVAADDVVARLGGDEFAVFRCRNRAARADLTDFAQEILAEIGAPYRINGHDLNLGASIGIAIARADDEDREWMVRHADLALQRAKFDGQHRFRFFEPAMEEDLLSRQQMTRDLREAIRNRELLVHYQPIVDAATLEVCAVEALARWPDPVRGMVPPLQFIRLAEEAGMIDEIGDWILRRACLDAAAWPAHIKLAVNVSSLQVNKLGFPGRVAEILSLAGLPPERLELEITEATGLSDIDNAPDVLSQLKRSGVAIVLDDFGTGYSSLSYLKQFPFDDIKIDKSFIEDIAARRGSSRIVSSLTSLARGFEMACTAEGVETREQYELMRAAAVARVQGRYFGEPAPAGDWDFTRPLTMA